MIPLITRKEFKYKTRNPESKDNPHNAVLKGYRSRKRDELVEYFTQRDFMMSTMKECTLRHERGDRDGKFAVLGWIIVLDLFSFTKVITGSILINMWLNKWKIRSMRLKWKERKGILFLSMFCCFFFSMGGMSLDNSLSSDLSLFYFFQQKNCFISSGSWRVLILPNHWIVLFSLLNELFSFLYYMNCWTFFCFCDSGFHLYVGFSVG